MLATTTPYGTTSDDEVTIITTASFPLMVNILKIAPTCGLASFAVVMFYKHHGELNDNETCLQYSPWQHSACMEQKWRFDKLLYNHAFMIRNLLGSWPGEQLYNLTLHVLEPSYLGLTRLISWLLMPWRRKEPGHQQSWYWLCRISRFLSYLRKDFNYLRHINLEKWHKMLIYVYVPCEKFST